MEKRSTFFKACESGDIIAAKNLLGQLDLSSFEERTREGRTCFHVAVISGDADLLRELAAKLQESGLINIIKRTDGNGDTALHLAVRKGRVDLMKQLVDLDASLCDCANKEGETPLKLAISLGLKEAVEFLITRTSNALHYVAQLDSELLGKLAAKLHLKELFKETDNEGNTTLHLAVRKDRVDLLKQLVDLDANLCNCANKEGQTPLILAVSLGFKEAVKFLITLTSNALHYIVELNQVKLVEYLIKEKVALSELINQPYQPDKEGNPATHTDTQDDQPILRQGDTPLHIAARNKNEHMVSLLLKVRGVNKLARNSEDKTPFEIAREVTEYYESFRIIRKLACDTRKPKPFMYCAPQVSHKKYKNARLAVNKAYEDRRNAELVVAALLAAMTCAAAFTVPGGFDSESPAKENPGSPSPSPSPSIQGDTEGQGTPLLISFISFKLFLVFDCVAFFLSLFVCIMWEMSSELTTGDKMLFMTVNSFVVCCSFGFTSYGFMSAVYAMLARKVIFSWVVLGSLIAITSCGVLAFIRQMVHFAVTRARFHRLCGVSCIVDDIVEKIWSRAERCGVLKFVRLGEKDVLDCITGHDKFGSRHSTHSSRSCSFNHV